MNHQAVDFNFDENSAVLQLGHRSFSLTPVTELELLQLRKNHVPSLVLKIGENLYHTELKKGMTVSITPCHCCNDPNHDCKRLLALPFEEGGCQKVEKFARRIENYPFITIGYETFWTQHNVLVVIECKNYEKSPARAKFDPIKQFNDCFKY